MWWYPRVREQRYILNIYILWVRHSFELIKYVDYGCGCKMLIDSNLDSPGLRKVSFPSILREQLYVPSGLGSIFSRGGGHWVRLKNSRTACFPSPMVRSTKQWTWVFIIIRDSGTSLGELVFMASPTLAWDSPRKDNIKFVPVLFVAITNQRFASWPRNKSWGRNDWIGH